jgi:peptidyl-prolyl cis-trans isomerase SurA
MMQAQCRSAQLQAARRRGTCRVAVGQGGGRWRRAGSHWFAALAAAFVLAGAAAPASAQVLAVVNGIPVTSYDVDQRTRLHQISGGKATGRKEVLQELIDDHIKVLEGKKYGMEPSTSEVDGAFAQMASRMRLKPAQLTQALNGRGIGVETLKLRIRADLVWGQLVRGRYQASLQVGEGELRAVLGQAEDSKGVGHVYTLRPILFIVPQGSPPSAFEGRRREADALRSRVNSCEEAVRLARELRDVAVREPIVRNSATLPAPFRTMLDSLEVGKLTAPDISAQGIETFALCSREVTRTETPRRNEVRQEIFAKRYEAQSKQYLERIRRSAMIEYK